MTSQITEQNAILLEIRDNTERQLIAVGDMVSSQLASRDGQFNQLQSALSSIEEAQREKLLHLSVSMSQQKEDVISQMKEEVKHLEKIYKEDLIIVKGMLQEKDLLNEENKFLHKKIDLLQSQASSHKWLTSKIEDIENPRGISVEQSKDRNTTDPDVHSEDEPTIEGGFQTHKIIADSMARDILSTCKELSFDCIGGATISRLTEHLAADKDHYGHLTWLVGTNDCSTASTMEELKLEYETLLQTASNKAVFVRACGLTPRSDDTTAQERVILLNTVIEEVCRKAQVEYVDNMETFLMLNGEPNDAYLLPDGLHLSKNGTVRLIKNLKLTDEAKHQDHRRKHKTSNHPSTKESTNKEYEKVYFAGRKHPRSNYYPSPLTVCGHTFPHLEGAYQTIGCLVSNQREKAEEIMRIQDPLTAMREGQKVKKGELWENTKVEVMRSLLHMKANQCPSYYDALMATGNSELVEDTHHQFWGRGKDNTGVNMCGILNAEVRSSLQRKIDPNTKEMPHWQKLLMDIPASKQPTIQNEQVKGKINKIV